MKNNISYYDLPGVDHLCRCKGKGKVIHGSNQDVAVCMDMSGTGAQNAPNFEKNLREQFPVLKEKTILMFYPKENSICLKDYCVVADSSGDWIPITFQAAKNFIGCTEEDFNF